MKYLNQIDEVFSEQECQILIQIANQKEWVDVDRGIASYQRVMIDDAELAGMLFKRLQDQGIIGSQYNGKQIKCLNERFRFSKYKPGQHFGMHKDGINVNQQGYRSIMTLNIFLNDNFDGGETDFYLEDKSTLRFSCKPKTGRGALFDSQQFHCGNEVKNGYKYLIRTDVMAE